MSNALVVIIVAAIGLSVIVLLVGGIVFFTNRDKILNFILALVNLGEGPRYSLKKNSTKPLPLIAFPVSCFITIALTTGYILLLFFDFSAVALNAISGALYLSLFPLSLLAVAISMLIQFRINVSRKLKYEVVLSACGILLVNFNSLSILLRLSASPYDSSGIPEGFYEALGALFVAPVNFILHISLCCLLFSIPLRLKKINRKNPPPFVPFLYMILFYMTYFPLLLMATATFFSPGMTTTLGILIIVARYYVGERMSLMPVLYFRSYQYDMAHEVFNKIILRISRKFSPVIALVYDKHAAYKFFSGMNFGNAASLISLSEMDWRDWVTNKIQRCCCVIIDTTGQSEGVLWELEQSKKYLEPSQIIVISQIEKDSVESHCIVYGHLHKRAFKRELLQALKGAFRKGRKR